MEKVKLIFAML